MALWRVPHTLCTLYTWVNGVTELKSFETVKSYKSSSRRKKQMIRIFRDSGSIPKRVTFVRIHHAERFFSLHFSKINQNMKYLLHSNPVTADSFVCRKCKKKQLSCRISVADEYNFSYFLSILIDVCLGWWYFSSSV